MGAIILIALAFGLAMFPTLRCALFHPVSLIRFGVLDLRDHFRHHEYDRCGSGELVAYTGLFGKGKTLSAACVGNLKKAMKEGDMMSEEEILKLQQNTQQSNMDGVAKPSKRWLKLRRQRHQ